MIEDELINTELTDMQVETSKKQKTKKVYFNTIYSDNEKSINKIDAEWLKKDYNEKVESLLKEYNAKYPEGNDKEKLKLDKKIKIAKGKIEREKASTYSGKPMDAGMKSANCYFRKNRRNDFARYVLHSLPGISSEFHTHKLIDPKIKVGCEYETYKAFQEDFKIFFACNACRSMDDFEKFCTKFDLEDLKELFLTTKKEIALNKRLEKRKQKFDETTSDEDSNSEEESETCLVAESNSANELIKKVPKFFEFIIEVKIFKDGKYLENEIVTIERQENKIKKDKIIKEKKLKTATAVEATNINKEPELDLIKEPVIKIKKERKINNIYKYKIDNCFLKPPQPGFQEYPKKHGSNKNSDTFVDQEDNEAKLVGKLLQSVKITSLNINRGNAKNFSAE
jgi:hypothetical protein